MGYGKIKMKKGGEKKVDMEKVKKDANKFMKMMKYRYGDFKMSYKVGGMKEVPAGKEGAGLRALPKSARNNMGYKKEGGMKKKMMGGTNPKMKKGGGYKMKK
jgi:hypothetical protein